MGRIRWMGPEGDRTVPFDETDAESLERARQMVERAFAEGRGVFRVDESGEASRLHAFDPRAREIVVIPHVAGG